MSANPPELVWALDIPSLTGGVLEEKGLEYIHQLLVYTEKELLAIPGIGKKGLSDIKRGLAERELSLRSE